MRAWAHHRSNAPRERASWGAPSTPLVARVPCAFRARRSLLSWLVLGCTTGASTFSRWRRRRGAELAAQTLDWTKFKIGAVLVSRQTKRHARHCCATASKASYAFLSTIRICGAGWTSFRETRAFTGCAAGREASPRRSSSHVLHFCPRELQSQMVRRVRPAASHSSCTGTGESFPSTPVRAGLMYPTRVDASLAM